MKKHPSEIINELLYKYSSLREFARKIREDATDVSHWRNGKSKVRPRAVIMICRLHQEIHPHDLNPDIFPDDLILKFAGN